jgi:hypothetical protein
MTRHCRNYTDADIANAARSSFSIAQVLRQLGLSPTGGNYVVMHAHFIRLGLDTSTSPAKATFGVRLTNGPRNVRWPRSSYRTPTTTALRT